LLPVGTGRRFVVATATVAIAAVLAAAAVACATSEPVTYAGRRVHVSLDATEKAPGRLTFGPIADHEPVEWQLTNADGSVQQTTTTDVGFDFRTPDDADDYWVWTDFPEHYSGVWNDSDGLQRTGSGSGPCRTDECIHIVVTPDGTVRLPNRDDQAVTSLFVQFFAPYHDDAPDRSNLPDDAAPGPHARTTSPPST
jgi:hypothetical protein